MTERTTIVKWWEIDWTTKPYSAGDSTEVRKVGERCTTLRHLEYEVFNRLKYQALLMVLNGGSENLTKAQWKLIDNERLLIEAGERPEDIRRKLARRHDATTDQIDEWLKRIDSILRLRQLAGKREYPNPASVGYRPMSLLLRESIQKG